MDEIQFLFFLIQLYFIFKSLFLFIIRQFILVYGCPQLRQLIREILLLWVFGAYLLNLGLNARNVTIGLGELLLYITEEVFPLNGRQGNIV